MEIEKGTAKEITRESARKSAWMGALPNARDLNNMKAMWKSRQVQKKTAKDILMNRVNRLNRVVRIGGGMELRTKMMRMRLRPMVTQATCRKRLTTSNVLQSTLLWTHRRKMSERNPCMLTVENETADISPQQRRKEQKWHTSEKR